MVDVLVYSLIDVFVDCAYACAVAAAACAGRASAAQTRPNPRPPRCMGAAARPSGSPVQVAATSFGETWPALEQYQAELVENFFINILQLCPDTMKLQREGFQRKKFLEFSKLVLTHITKAWRLTVETLK